MRRFTALLAAVCVGLTAPAAPAAAAEPDATARARVLALLGSDHQNRVAALEDRLGLADDDLGEFVESVIDPDDYVCDDDTEVFAWAADTMADWTEEDALTALAIVSLGLPFWEAMVFPEPAGERVFGADGEYTGTLQRSYRNLKRFWDIDGSGIELVPAHGGVLRDTARMTRALLAQGVPEADAAELAAAIAEVVDQPQFDFGDHPLFTFNAFAFSTQGEQIPGLGVPTDKIIMGDGILDAFQAIGLGGVAPQAVLGHEYGHHIQLQRNLFESPLTGAEATRRTELMADSFGSYHASHKRGDALRWGQARKVLETFYNLGDCGFDSDSHHGTPNQRLRAADWGNDVARNPRVLPSLTFAGLFERRLPEFVAPDAG